MKFTYLLLLTLIGLASCRASLEQRVYKELPAQPENAPIALLTFNDLDPDPTVAIADINISFNAMSGFTNNDIVSMLINQTREKGGNLVQITKSTPNFQYGGYSSLGATIFYINDLEQHQKYAKRIIKNELSLYRMPYAPRFELTVDGGYSYAYRKLEGLNQEELKTEKNLRHGLSYQVNANVLISPSQGIGLVYNGFESNAPQEVETSLKQSINFFGLCWHIKGHIDKNIMLSTDIGMGYANYLRQQLSPNLRRKIIEGNGAGLYIGWGIDYRFAKSFGVGININLLIQSFGNTYTYDESGLATKLKDPLSISRINTLAGLRYYLGSSKPNLKPKIRNAQLF